MWKSKYYGAFVLNRRVDLHAIDAPPARWRGNAGSSPIDRARTQASSPRNDLVKNSRVHPTRLISTQVLIIEWNKVKGDALADLLEDRGYARDETWRA